MENKAAVPIPADVLSQVSQKLSEIHQLIQPFVITLTDSERKTMVKMSDKSSAFVRKVGDYMSSNPEFIPSYISAADFKVDYENVSALSPLAKIAGQVCDSLNDTILYKG